MPWMEHNCGLLKSRQMAPSVIKSELPVVLMNHSAPEWSPDGILYTLSLTGQAGGISTAGAGGVEPLCEMAAEFGLPSGCLMSTMRLNLLVKSSAPTPRGRWHLASLDTTTQQLQVIDTPYTEISLRTRDCCILCCLTDSINVHRPDGLED